MTARIMADALVRPVIGDIWHQTNVARRPAQGEPITTLCGITDTVDYSDQTTEVFAAPCWHCDLRYREDHGLPVQVRHPAARWPSR